MPAFRPRVADKIPMRAFSSCSRCTIRLVLSITTLLGEAESGCESGDRAEECETTERLRLHLSTFCKLFRHVTMPESLVAIGTELQRDTGLKCDIRHRP